MTLLIVYLLLLMVWQPQAAMARSPEAVNRADTLALVDAAWDALEPDFITAQKDYYAMTGRYFQGLRSHRGDVPDADSGGDYPSGWLTHPTDQQYRWSDFGLKLEKMEFEIWIDVYDGPEGPGWVACVNVYTKKEYWQKCRNYGPEALRSHDWELVTSEQFWSDQ